MPNLFDPEYNQNPVETEYSVPAEESLPKEYAASLDEYNEKSASFPAGEKKDQHKRIKELFLKPVVAVLVAASAMLASLGIDPLGKSAAPASPSAPSFTPASPSSPSTELPVTGETPPALSPDPFADDAFPDLGNPNPDFAGAYAWAGTGTENSEEFLILTAGDGEKAYLVAGGYYRNQGVTESALPGASYDRAANTLTLTDFDDPGAFLEGNLMGNGFKIRLVGKNALRGMQFWGAMYGGSVTLTGTGSLIVGGVDPMNIGVLLQAENSASALMIDRGVNVEIHGLQAAFASANSTAEKALYYLRPLWLLGGVPAEGVVDENGEFTSETEKDPFLYTVMDEETGGFAKTIRFTAEETR